MKSFPQLLVTLLSLNLAVPVQAAGDLPWMKPSTVGRPQPGVPVNPSPLNSFKSGTNAKACSTVINALRFNAAYSLLANALNALPSDPRVKMALTKYGLTITDTSWQDTGRYNNSSGGSNMSDVTLAALVMDRNGEIRTVKQPIIRLDNFKDITVDVDLNQVFIPVGNSWGVEPFAVSLREFIENLSEFTSLRESVKSLLAPRDNQLLVSAQTAVLPVPAGGEAHFVPAMYNYQSNATNSAALVIMSSNRGTSVTIIDNARDKVTDGRGQMLFHNANGQKTAFTAQAETEVQATRAGRKRIKDLQNSGQSIAGQAGVNQVMMITIPLKYPRNAYRGYLGGGAMLESMGAATAMPMRRLRSASVDRAVVDVAKYSLGEFVELNGKGKGLERDEDNPIRVDVIRYMVSETDQLNPTDIAKFPEELRGVYEAGKNIGSLVTGDLRNRVTRTYQPWRQPWWDRVIVIAPPIYRVRPWVVLEKLYGPTWMYRFANEEIALKTIQGLPANP